MKRGESKLRRFFGDRKIQLLIVLLVIILAVGGYLYFNQKVKCENYTCFTENMRSCSKATYVNSGEQAIWRYEILGKNSEGCEVEAKLIQAKEGELKLNQLEGYGMACTYPDGFATYPESDLSKCHGRLKEEFQGIIIERLHTHILQNLGKVDEKLKEAL